MPLTDTAILHASSKEKPYKLSDERGLYLLITRAGKYWRLKYRRGGREKGLALGVYPDVSLEQAREKRDAYRQLLKNGHDPAEFHKAEKQARREREARQIAETRFLLDSKGALSIRLGNRRVDLTTSETVELRLFLDSTRNVEAREESCP